VTAGPAVPGYRIEGHAIVSADDRIAAADGTMPATLHNAADWVRFQAELDRAVLVVVGRASHEANPNRRARPRLVVSSSATGIERRADAWWWNPAKLAVADAFAAAAPQGGIIAVPGGRRVFDLFLALGFDAFHLARAERLHIAGGIPVFSAVDHPKTAVTVLAEHGMVAGAREVLDAAAGVTLTEWRRDAAD